MKRYVSILIIFFTFSCVPEFYPLPIKNPFIITQSMNYKKSVDLTAFGVNDIVMVNESLLLSASDKEETVSEPALQDIAQNLPKDTMPVAIDIGRWSIYISDTLKRTENLQKLIFVIETLRTARPDIKFGYYGLVPERVYEPLVDFKLNEWISFNDAAKNDFAPHVDAIFPILYTQYAEPLAWETFAKNMLMEAKRFNKPVYAFLCPRFHESNPTLGGQYLPADYWRLELETCYKFCDGIVIWNSEPTKNWNPATPWWKETLLFIDEITGQTF